LIKPLAPNQIIRSFEVVFACFEEDRIPIRGHANTFASVLAKNDLIHQLFPV